MVREEEEKVVHLSIFSSDHNDHHRISPKMSEPTSNPASTSTPAPPPAEPAPAGQEELNEDGTPLSDNQKKKRAKKAEAERLKAEKAAKLAADKKAKEASEVVSARNQV